MHLAATGRGDAECWKHLANVRYAPSHLTYSFLTPTPTPPPRGSNSKSYVQNFGAAGVFAGGSSRGGDALGGGMFP